MPMEQFLVTVYGSWIQVDFHHLSTYMNVSSITVDKNTDTVELISSDDGGIILPTNVTIVKEDEHFYQLIDGNDVITMYVEEDSSS